MKRIANITSAASLAALLCGCAMCQNPYDYAGPVPGHAGCPTCGSSTWRAGSAISGTQYGTPQYGAPQYGAAPNGAPAYAGSAQMSPTIQTQPQGMAQPTLAPQYETANQATPAQLR